MRCGRTGCSISCKLLAVESKSATDLLALDEKGVCSTTELRTCYRRTVKAISILLHYVVMREWNNKGQRVEMRGLGGLIEHPVTAY